METRNDIPNLLAMYIRNTREIYDITTWLQDCIIKKANKGIQPSIEHLANCSTMKTIIREAAKLWNNTHKTGKTGSGPGTCRIYFRMCAILHPKTPIEAK